MLRLALALACLPALVALAGTARADALPDQPEPAEHSCTLERVAAEAGTCELCGAWYGDPAACRTVYAPRGWEQRCRTAGPSSWDEVWCAPRAPAPPVATTVEEPADGTEASLRQVAPAACGCAGLGALGAGAGLMIYLARRRSR